MTGADVEAAARAWIGTRYRHQGRSRDGVDCIGYPVVVRESLGLQTPPVPLDYAPLPIDDAMVVYCKTHMVEIDRASLQPGDLVILQYKVARHIGIIATYPHGGLSMLHARSTHPRKVAETPFTDAWIAQDKCRVLGCFRFPEIA